MEPFDVVLARWVEAEASNDIAALDALLADEFRGDGPDGFVLDKRAWLDRHALGGVVVDSLEWAALDVRVRGHTAVAMGVQRLLASSPGQEIDVDQACTVVAVNRGDAAWEVVNVQVTVLAVNRIGHMAGSDQPPGRCPGPGIGRSSTPADQQPHQSHEGTLPMDINPTDPTTVLDDQLAQELLSARIPARFAYVGVDGAPRVVPVGFHWTGTSIVIGTSTVTPKVAALRANPKVALTIDTNVAPQNVLLIRGDATVEIVDGVFPEYLEGARKLVPDEMWEGFQETVHHTYEQMARIEITPTWAKLFDFQTRVPKFIEDMVRAHEDA